MGANEMRNKNILLSISLKPIQIDMVVDTDNVVVNELMDLYKHTPTEDWGGGVGIRRYFEDMWHGLQKGYKYFISNPEKIANTNQGWIEFCNDCLRCSVLYSVMVSEPLMFVDSAEKRQWLIDFSAKFKLVTEQGLLQVSI